MALANTNRAALGHTGIQHPEFHSTGQPALFILVHAGPTTAWFPYGKDDFIRPGWIEKQKIVKNVRKLTFLRKNMTILKKFDGVALSTGKLVILSGLVYAPESIMVVISED